MHGGKTATPIKHGAYSKLLRERPGFGRFLDAVSEMSSESGLSMGPEIETLRARLLEVQSQGGDPQAEVALASAIDKMRRGEQVMAGLVPRDEAIGALQGVLGVVHDHVDRETWDAIWADMGRRGLGGLRAIQAGDD